MRKLRVSKHELHQNQWMHNGYRIVQICSTLYVIYKFHDEKVISRKCTLIEARKYIDEITEVCDK